MSEEWRQFWKSFCIGIFLFTMIYLLDMNITMTKDLKEKAEKITNIEQEVQELWENIDAMSEDYNLLHNEVYGGNN